MSGGSVRFVATRRRIGLIDGWHVAPDGADATGDIGPFRYDLGGLLTGDVVVGGGGADVVVVGLDADVGDGADDVGVKVADVDVGTGLDVTGDVGGGDVVVVVVVVVVGAGLEVEDSGGALVAGGCAVVGEFTTAVARPRVIGSVPFR